MLCCPPKWSAVYIKWKWEQELNKFLNFLPGAGVGEAVAGRAGSKFIGFMSMTGRPRAGVQTISTGSGELTSSYIACFINIQV